MVFYFRYEKARVERLRVAEAAKGVGRPKVGGKFELLDQDGRRFSSEEDMKGRFSLVSLEKTFRADNGRPSGRPEGELKPKYEW